MSVISSILATRHGNTLKRNQDSQLYSRLSGAENGFIQHIGSMDFNLMKMVLSLCQLLNSAYKLAPKVIYAELHIWSKDSQGNDLLTSLKQKGIGAIYLNHEDTPFKISDNRNNAQGELWSSGIYVSEVGIIGTMQQIDLIV